MFGGGFGEAGAEVVIEEFLHGEEVSLFALTDGEAVMPFGSAQDHKRVGDGDTGPNTGGMGAYSPAHVLTPELEAQAMAQILIPTVEAMAAVGTPYSGVLYAGLMLTPDGPKLREYNARFGDPECQVLMMRLEDDLLEIMLAVAGRRLGALPTARFADQAALTVVMAATGYPGPPEKGGRIAGIDAAEATGAKIFQAGTAQGPAGLVAADATLPSPPPRRRWARRRPPPIARSRRSTSPQVSIDATSAGARWRARRPPPRAILDDAALTILP